MMLADLLLRTLVLQALILRALGKDGRLIDGDAMNQRIGVPMHQFPPRRIPAIDLGDA